MKNFFFFRLFSDMRGFGAPRPRANVRGYIGLLNVLLGRGTVPATIRRKGPYTTKNRTKFSAGKNFFFLFFSKINQCQGL